MPRVCRLIAGIKCRSPGRALGGFGLLELGRKRLRVLWQVSVALFVVRRMIVHDGQPFDGIMIEPCNRVAGNTFIGFGISGNDEPAQKRDTLRHALFGDLHHGNLISRRRDWSVSSATFLFMNSFTTPSS